MSLVQQHNKKLWYHPDGNKIRKSWRALGSKPLNYNIIRFNGMRLIKCQNGYALLCYNEVCFNLIGCKKHKKDKEQYSYCRHDGCDKRSTYGYIIMKPLYCTTHKKEDMIDVKYKPCRHPGCDTSPSYGILGGEAVSCFYHKDDDMVDVKNKRCQEVGCKKRAFFNIKGEAPIYCELHKGSDMVYIGKCYHPYCTNTPIFGHKDEGLLYCWKHKTTPMQRLI